MAKVSTVRDLRRRNRSALLRPLFLEGRLTRPELTGASGLSQATVSNVIGELQNEGLIVDAGTVDSDGGRPRQVLRIDADYGYVVGVDVGETRIRTELFDLSMEQRAAADHPLAHATAVEELADTVAATVRSVIDEAGVPPGHVLGVGVGVPGLVEHDDEVLVHGHAPGWQSVPLETLLRERIDQPLLIENGAKTLGQAEMWFGAGRGRSAAVIALLGTGVGACVVTGGSIYRGSTSSAGEWGHTVLQVGGRPCRCGGSGCLEAYVGADALLARYTGLTGRPPLEGVAPEAAVAQLVVHDPDDEAAAAVLAETVEYVGAGVANLVNLFNPEIIVLGGWVGLLLGRSHLPAIRDAAARYALRQPFERTDITVAQLGVDAVAMGAATLPVDELLATGAVGATQQRAALRP
ncbi:ROK family transcriptional regulator [Streptomyces sp. PSKA28]|uniref:ROK family transcriptional regulator n=2 Tax=Streptomyces TaxID=1883 RepID=A0A7W0DMC5_9ACTN|nr:ROK family transcriptional regulator [Streptomyces himalayensis subsp. himalayensis]